MRRCMFIATPTQFVSDILGDGLWHTTSSERFAAINDNNLIMVEPQISDRGRHKTASGPSNYPYARTLGAVSVFDFAAFDESEYALLYPVSNWHAFVPIWHGWTRAIWLKLDRIECGAKVVSGSALLERWRAEKAYAHTLMPRIEAAHIGDIPLSSISQVLEVIPLARGWEVKEFDFKACQSIPAPA